MLIDQVVARFLAESTPVEVAFGPRALALNTDGARVVIVPGNTAGGAGKVVAASHDVDASIRAQKVLAGFDELFTARIYSEDVNDPRDDAAQYLQARLVFDAFYRASFYGSRSLMQIADIRWDTERRESGHGLTMIVVFSIIAPIIDVPLGVAAFRQLAPVPRGATLDLELHDHESQIVINVPPP